MMLQLPGMRAPLHKRALVHNLPVECNVCLRAQPSQHTELNCGQRLMTVWELAAVRGGELQAALEVQSWRSRGCHGIGRLGRCSSMLHAGAVRTRGLHAQPQHGSRNSVRRALRR